MSSTQHSETHTLATEATVMHTHSYIHLTSIIIELLLDDAFGVF
jgi:hypothetical protein